MICEIRSKYFDFSRPISRLEDLNTFMEELRNRAQLRFNIGTTGYD